MTALELTEAREAAGLTTKQAAEFSGTPYRTWHSWECEGKDGRRPPGIAFKWLEQYRKMNHNQADPPSFIGSASGGLL